MATIHSLIITITDDGVTPFVVLLAAEIAVPNFVAKPAPYELPLTAELVAALTPILAAIRVAAKADISAKLVIEP